MYKKRYASYSAKRNIIIVISVFLLGLFYFFRDFNYLYRVASTVGLVALFYIIDHLFDVRFRLKHYILILIISIAGILFFPAYFYYAEYDKVLHFTLPIMFSSIVFYMVNQLDLDFKWKATFTFFIVVGSLGLFEIGEYILDILFDLKLQGVYVWSSQGLGGLEKLDLIVDKLDDTMIDMMFGVLGAFLYVLAISTIFKKKILLGK